MDELIRYIFNNMRCSENTLRTISRMLKKQNSVNRGVIFLGAAMTFHIIVQDMEIRSMRCKLENLKKEIKEIKNSEGD